MKPEDLVDVIKAYANGWQIQRRRIRDGKNKHEWEDLAYYCQGAFYADFNLLIYEFRIKPNGEKWKEYRYEEDEMTFEF